ncbi:MAG TPA: TIM barrel protein [Thermomicrobiales bacterium]|jgi:sugar phosphate isomerase/epimerase
MQTVLFTKLFRGRTLEEIGATARDLGFDGIDLLIRAGHQLEPAEPGQIPAAARLLEGYGLAVPMATTDITEPATFPVERLFGQCAAAGIRVIRLGYWRYDPAKGYAACLEAARRELMTLAEMAQRAGVRLAIQIHGGTIHSSGALMMRLLADHDPSIVGAYPDPGNQAVQEGREDWRLTLDVLRAWLCCIGVKNGGWFPAVIDADGQRRWTSDWLGLADGMVPWADILPYLGNDGYHGLLSFHSHYEAPYPQVLDQTRTDLRFIRRLLDTR